MPPAFALAGGASLGAVEADMLQALSERGVTPDILERISAGAPNAGFSRRQPAGGRGRRLGGSRRRRDAETREPPVWGYAALPDSRSSNQTDGGGPSLMPHRVASRSTR